MLPIPWGSIPVRSRTHAARIVYIFNGLYPRNRGGSTVPRPRLVIPLGQLESLPVHWDGRQTVPCILGCRFCANGHDPRGAGYVPALLFRVGPITLSGLRRVVWCIPEAEYSGDSPRVTGTLRSRVFEVSRDFRGDLVIREQSPLPHDPGIETFSVQEILNPHFEHALPELTTLANALTPQPTPATPTPAPTASNQPPAISAVTLARLRNFVAGIGKGGAQ